MGDRPPQAAARSEEVAAPGDERADDDDAVVAPALLHGAAFGALLAAFSLALLAAGCLVLQQLPRSWLVPVALGAMGVVGGLALVPVALVERLAARWPGGEARDLRVALLAIAAGALGLALATPQAVYINFGLGGPERGLRLLERWFADVLRFGDDGKAYLWGLLQLGVPFGPCAVARVRGLPLWAQCAATFVVTFGLELLLLGAGKLLIGRSALEGVALAALFVAALLPAVRRLADQVEAAARRALAPRER